MRKISTSLLVSLGWEKSTGIQVSRSGLKFNLRPMGPSRKIYLLLVLCVAKNVEGKEHGSVQACNKRIWTRLGDQKSFLPEEIPEVRSKGRVKQVIGEVRWKEGIASRVNSTCKSPVVGGGRALQQQLHKIQVSAGLGVRWKLFPQGNITCSG